MSEVKLLPKFPREVNQALATLVNNYGVRVRKADGSHVMIYNGQRGTPPFKLSASRPAEQTLRYLSGWARENVKGWRG